jgi:YVTN family beta-propeller protein
MNKKIEENQMKSLFCITAMVALTLLSLASSSQAYLVYMVDSSNNIVRVYDTEKKILSETIPVGQFPQNITFTPDGKTAYVANLKSNSVTAIRTLDNKVVGDIPIGAPAKKIAITPDGKTAYVTSQGGLVSVIDTVNNLVISRFSTQGYGGERYGSGLVVSPDGKKVYICEEKSIAVVDTATNAVRRIQLSTYANEKIVLSRNGKRAYILNVLHGLIEVLDTTKDKIVNKICYLGAPWDAAEAPDQLVLYVSVPVLGELSKKGRGAILTVDVNQPECTSNGYLDILFLAPRAFGLAVLPDNSTIFVAHRQDHEVSAINVKTKEITTISGAYADALAIRPVPQSSTLTQGSIGPSEIALAKMSNYTYMIGKTGQLPSPIDEYQLIKPVLGSDGFAADVFRKGNHIVIAFRGTELSLDDIGTAVANLHADVPWLILGVDKTPTLKSYVKQAANLLLRIHEENPLAEITLTGHSLGGAIAQILGAVTKLPTLAFNAPGTADQLSKLKDIPALEQFNNNKILFTNHGANISIHMYADRLSEAGKPIDQVVTIFPPSGMLDWNSVKEGPLILRHLRTLHSMELMIQQLENGARRIPGEQLFWILYRP